MKQLNINMRDKKSHRDNLEHCNAHLDCTEQAIMNLMRQGDPAQLPKVVALIEERERIRCYLHDLHIKIYQ